jgi:hypothetical protein
MHGGDVTAKPRRKKDRNRHSANPPESQASDSITVAWSLTVVTLLVLDIGAALTRLYLRAEGGPLAMEVLAGWLLFSAAVMGAVSLALLPAVFKLRREPPPTGFTALGVAVAVAPLLVVLAQLLR